MDLNKSKKKFCFLIPARGGSKEIKNKNLKKIRNKSLVGHAIQFSKLFSNEKSIFVHTDSQKIKSEAERYNVEIINRPKILSGDKISDYKILEHTIKNISTDYKYIIYLQPTSPFRKKNDLLESIKFIEKKNFDSIWSVTKIDKKYNPLKVLINNKEILKLFTNEGKKVAARQMLKDAFIRNGVFYIFKISSLKKYKSIYLKNCSYKIITSNHINIDMKRDLYEARKLASKIEY